MIALDVEPSLPLGGGESYRPQSSLSLATREIRLSSVRSLNARLTLGSAIPHFVLDTSLAEARAPATSANPPQPRHPVELACC